MPLVAAPGGGEYSLQADAASELFVDTCGAATCQSELQALLSRGAPQHA